MRVQAYFFALALTVALSIILFSIGQLVWPAADPLRRACSQLTPDREDPLQWSCQVRVCHDYVSCAGVTICWQFGYARSGGCSTPASGSGCSMSGLASALLTPAAAAGACSPPPSLFWLGPIDTLDNAIVGWCCWQVVDH